MEQGNDDELHALRSKISSIRGVRLLPAVEAR
jgi:hypothetical protein